MFAENISKEQLNELPLIQFTGTIYVIDTPEKVAPAIADLKYHSILGFDTETRPSFKKGRINSTALVQLATRDAAYLFRLNKIGFPKELQAILATPTITKIGLGLKDDIKALKEFADFEPEAFIDLQEIVPNYDIEVKSLKKLAGITLDIRISKNQQLSNWERDELSEGQQRYAATDAWVCLEIYDRLEQAT
ncbi:MAG: 3'-5' exonuclease [Bacteroidales bacterium]|jgi:ribonuclease D